tara:strand:- start:1556 stop:1837 length:282 start_codon:yes stop_codon:yes gene_type:complete
MKNKKINSVRIKLDNLDNKLLDLIKKRTSLVNQILKAKKFKKQIVDKKRIKVILKRIRKKSQQRKIDTKLTNRIWKSMIYSYIDYEYRNFKKR